MDEKQWRKIEDQEAGRSWRSCRTLAGLGSLGSLGRLFSSGQSLSLSFLNQNV